MTLSVGVWPNKNLPTVEDRSLGPYTHYPIERYEGQYLNDEDECYHEWSTQPQKACWTMRLPIKTSVAGPRPWGSGYDGIEGYVPNSFFHAFHALSEITLRFEDPDPDDPEMLVDTTICDELLLLPTVQKLTVKGHNVYLSEQTYWKCPRKGSPITHLKWESLSDSLWYRWDLENPSYVPFLEYFSALKTLRALIYKYCHRSIGQALQSQKDSVETLDLRNKNPTYYTILRPPVSFRDFSQLKHISLPDVVLWGSAPTPPDYFIDPIYITAQHLGKILPQCLETFAHRVFREKEGGMYAFMGISPKERLTLYPRIWNEGGASTFFPHLRRVEQIEEDEDWYDRNHVMRQPWEPVRYTIWPRS